MIKSKHGKGEQGKFMETRRNDGLQQRLRQNKELEMLLFTNTCLRAIPKDNHGMFLEFRMIRERRWKELETSTIKNKFFHRKPVKSALFPHHPHSDAAIVCNHPSVPRMGFFKTLHLLCSPCWTQLPLNSTPTLPPTKPSPAPEAEIVTSSSRFPWCFQDRDSTSVYGNLSAYLTYSHEGKYIIHFPAFNA